MAEEGARAGIGASEIDHVGIAVRDLDAAVEHYRRTLGAQPVHRETVPDQGVEEVLFRVGASYVQLLAATGPDTPVGRFLERRGEGVHHVGYRVADIAAAIERLKSEGVPMVDDTPRPGSRGTTVAFVHPKGFAGVLVELVQEGGPGGSSPAERSGADQAAASPGRSDPPKAGR